jgi:mRNA interferase HigB
VNLVNRNKLERLKRKNRGNTKLIKAVDTLIYEIENADWKNPADVKRLRPDADNVHSDGFYFFNLNVHRTLILIEFEENGEATVVWAGSHQEYEKTFRNNKNTIKKWLHDNEWI